ncbi:MAG TPA: alpha/beta hydrolase-fold protein [Jiangellaceae bacterium]
MLVTAIAVGVGSHLVAQPAAAVGEDSWVTIPADDIYRFTVPNSAVQAATGTSAAMVAVEGNFGPGKTWSQLNMSLSGGNWTGTIGPLEPGLYYYQYEATIAGSEALIGFRNPNSPQEVTSKPSWNTFFVPGESAAWLADVPGGGQLETITYDSTVAGGERSALVWTPPGYDPNRAEPYPVLYLLQDDGQSYREWAELGRVAQILDNLAVVGELEPMVVVMGDGDSADARAEVIDNLVPAARDAFNISAEPAHQAIAGIGRGASQALSLLLTDTGMFSKVASFSGSLAGDVSAAKAAEINAATDLIRVYVGNVTDPSYNATVNMVERFDTTGVEYEFDGINPATGGIWESWQVNLRDFASRLFRPVEDHGPSEGHLAWDGPHSLPAPGTTPTPWIDENNIVTFETGTEYADATNITIWANWAPAGGWLRIPMEKQADGRWRLTVGPLEGGSYYYKFVVDRVDHKDASNPTTVTSEPAWSTFYVPGDNLRGRYTGDVPADQRGEVTTMSYQSTAGDQQRTAYVWTPPGYDPDREQPYPVFFLQHGGGQTWTDWIEVGFAAQILDNTYRVGDLIPMVVVMANGNGVNFPNELLQRIVPAAEAAYNVSSDPTERAIAGLSLGSGHALSTLFNFPGEFGYVGAFSAFGSVPASADVNAINEGTKLLRIYTGDIQDFTYRATLNLVSSLTNRGVDHEFAPVIPGPHSWDVWQKALIDLLPRLFEDRTPPITTAELTSEAVTGFGGHVKAVVTLTADDGPSGGSGVATTEYRVDGGDWISYGGPVLVNGDNPPREVVFEYRSIDANGNVEATKALPFTPVGKHDD